MTTIHEHTMVGLTKLTPEALECAARPVRILLDEDTLERVARCREFAQQRLDGDDPVYGAHTGFGPLVGYPGRETHADQCDNLLDHLTAGQGPDLEPAVVRAAMLVRLRSLSQGLSGVSVPVVTALAAALATGFAPAVPRWGSVGASGDLIPLAYVARALGGDGRAFLDGTPMPADEALTLAGLSPLVLDGRDALALVNGTALTAAAAGLAVASLRRSHAAAAGLTALMTDILGCTPEFLSPALIGAFGHADTESVAGSMRTLLTRLVPSGDRPLQEPYSIRCTPQLLGAAGASIRHAGDTVSDDLNGVSDNPLFFPESGEVVHGGNFFGQPCAFAADLLTLAATQLANLAERQLDLMVDPHRNGGLPPVLSADPGRQHGVQGVQLAATAIVANLRRSATPASVQSLPTNLHNQDVVPFGTQAALNALDAARALRWVHGSLALALRQAVFVGGRRPTAPACAAAMAALAAAIPPVAVDRALDADVRRAADVLDDLVTGGPLAS